MKRRYHLGEMNSFFKRATAIMSDLCIGTDLMVGFLGETEEDFAKTCETFVHGLFSYSHVFIFGKGGYACGQVNRPSAHGGKETP